MLIQRMSGYPAAVLRVVCRYCTVISRVGGLAVDVARAPAHPVVGVAGGLARAVGEPATEQIFRLVPQIG